MTDQTTPTATSASIEFDRLFGEASDLLARLSHALADGEWPAGLTWAHAGDMGRLVADLRSISDYVFAEGEHAAETQPEGADPFDRELEAADMAAELFGPEPAGESAAMTPIDRDHVGLLASGLADIRDQLEDLQARFERVMADVRALPGGELQWQRVDAYPGTRLDRDMGAGKGAVEWVEEVGTFLEEEVLGR